MADEFWQRVVGKIDQPESVLAGGYVGDPVPDENLTGVPKTLKLSQQFRFRGIGKIENLKFSLSDGIKTIFHDLDRLTGTDARNFLVFQQGTESVFRIHAAESGGAKPLGQEQCTEQIAWVHGWIGV
jgi:hypothetical protein